MDIILESDVALDNNKIISEIQKIIPDAAVINIKIRSQRQHDLQKQFDIALDEDNREKAELALKQFEETLFAPDGTATMKLMNIQLAGLSPDDIHGRECMKETELTGNYWLITYYFKWMNQDIPANIANTVTTLDPADWLMSQTGLIRFERYYIYVVNAIRITKLQYDRLDKTLPDLWV